MNAVDELDPATLEHCRMTHSGRTDTATMHKAGNDYFKSQPWPVWRRAASLLTIPAPTDPDADPVPTWSQLALDRVVNQPDEIPNEANPKAGPIPTPIWARLYAAVHGIEIKDATDAARNFWQLSTAKTCYAVSVSIRPDQMDHHIEKYLGFLIPAKLLVEQYRPHLFPTDRVPAEAAAV